MSDRYPVTVFEIDIDFCPLVFGVGACTAAFSDSVVRKCFNTYYTCKSQADYQLGTKTIRFVQPVMGYPVGETVFPFLVSVTGSSGMVNIAGSDDSMNALGVRASGTATFVDAPYHDRFFDKYAAERITGAAQTDEGGYDPQDRGSFWGKFKARVPNYADRACRVITGYLDNGVFTEHTRRNFVIDEISGPTSAGITTVKYKDVLSLADDEYAVAPATSTGYLAGDVGAGVGAVLTLAKTGVGNAEYPSSGRAVIGSEMVSFTRSGNTVTLTGRGLGGTSAASHSANDTFQVTYSVDLARIDAVIADLLINYANVPASWVPTAEWATEVTRWASGLKLKADITEPTGVNELIGELAVLGVSIWWDDVNQKIGLRINRPPDTDGVTEINDDANIVEITQDDNDDNRLTRVVFNTVQIDVTKGNNKENFYRSQMTINADAESPFAFDGIIYKYIYCRWLNQGDNNGVRVLAKRLLNRFDLQPVLYEFTTDIRDDLALTDVISLKSRVKTDDTGNATATLAQVIKRQDVEIGHQAKYKVQKFQFDQRYGYITENTRPTYTLSSDVQRARGCYIVDENTLLFGDNTGPYRII